MLINDFSSKYYSGVFSTGATGALAPVILGQYYCHLPLAPTILGQSITVSTRNSKVLNTPLNYIGRGMSQVCKVVSKMGYLHVAK